MSYRDDDSGEDERGIFQKAYDYIFPDKLAGGEAEDGPQEYTDDDANEQFDELNE